MKEEMTQDAVQENGTLVEGRNAVLEAFRSGKTIDKLYVLDGCKDGPVFRFDQLDELPNEY